MLESSRFLWRSISVNYTVKIFSSRIFFLANLTVMVPSQTLNILGNEIIIFSFILNDVDRPFYWLLVALFLRKRRLYMFCFWQVGGK